MNKIELTPEQQAEKVRREAEKEQKEVAAFWHDVREVEIKHKRYIKPVIIQEPTDGSIVPKRFPAQMDDKFLEEYKKQHKELKDK